MISTPEDRIGKVMDILASVPEPLAQFLEAHKRHLDYVIDNPEVLKWVDATDPLENVVYHLETSAALDGVELGEVSPRSVTMAPVVTTIQEREVVSKTVVELTMDSCLAAHLNAAKEGEPRRPPSWKGQLMVVLTNADSIPEHTQKVLLKKVRDDMQTHCPRLKKILVESGGHWPWPAMQLEQRVVSWVAQTFTRRFMRLILLGEVVTALQQQHVKMRKTGKPPPYTYMQLRADLKNVKKGTGSGARPPGPYLLPPWDKVEGGKKGRGQNDDDDEEDD